MMGFVYREDAMAECKVSILCTAYNHEEYIADALEGFVTQQTDFPFEVLISDDASTDKTADIIRDYAERYPDIIRPFLFEENQYGQGTDIYRSYFYPNARGEYIAMCEGDDYWTDPQKLKLQVDWLDAHPEYSASAHNTIFLDCRTGRQDVHYAQTGDRDLSFDDVIPCGGNAYHTSSLVYRREFSFERPDFVQVAKGYGDYPRAILLALHGPIRFIDRVMSVYRLSSGPSAFSSAMVKQSASVAHYENVLEMLSLVGSHVSETQCKALEKAILGMRYHLLEERGEVREMTKPPYDTVLRTKSRWYRLKIRIKCFAPRLYRKWLLRHDKD